MEKTELKKRIHVLGIPVDIFTQENLEALVMEMVEDGGNHQILFLRTLDLLRARRNASYQSCLRRASLIVPVSRSLVGGAAFLKRDKLFRYMPFEFTIRLLGILEKHGKSVYLIGNRPKGLQVASGNLRTSFPGLNQVGRYAGYFKSDVEKNILLAIKKASPTLLLAGEGVPRRDMWIDKQKKTFNPGLYLWCGECFSVFSGKKDRPSRRRWEHGTDAFPAALIKPWRLLRGFLYLYYSFLLLIHRLGRR